MLRVLPDNQNKQHQVLKRVCQDLGLSQKPKHQRTQATISEAIVKQVQDFYKNDSISWQAPGKRDCLTIRENGIRVKHQKRFLLFNIREVHELFIQDHPGMSKYFSLKRSVEDRNR